MCRKALRATVGDLVAEMKGSMVTKKKLATVAFFTAATSVMLAPNASATIHPIVESFDCANGNAYEHHPLGDPADSPGQTPGENHSSQSALRGSIEAGDTLNCPESGRGSDL